MADPKKVALLILGKDGSGKKLSGPSASEDDTGDEIEGGGKVAAMRELGEALKDEKWSEAFDALQSAVDLCACEADEEE